MPQVASIPRSLLASSAYHVVEPEVFDYVARVNALSGIGE
jgi:hypothetical protein